MATDEYGNVTIGLVISVEELRSVLRGLKVNGKRYWLASDPDSASEIGMITVGFGDRSCSDPLNRAFFRIPIVRESAEGSPDRLMLLFDASVIEQEDRGYQLAEKQFISESPIDFGDFFCPLKSEPVKRLQSGE